MVAINQAGDSIEAAIFCKHSAAKGNSPKEQARVEGHELAFEEEGFGGTASQRSKENFGDSKVQEPSLFKSGVQQAPESGVERSTLWLLRQYRSLST